MTAKAGSYSGESDAVPAAVSVAEPQRAQTLLAFDFGTRFVGIAVGDTETRSAHPLEMIDAEDNATRFARIRALVDEWRPARFVVGLPLSPDGAENDMTRRARRFAKQLEGRFRLTVEMVDERLSSASAEELLASMGRGGRNRKNDSHALAAQIILQDLLNKGSGLPKPAPCISPKFAGTE
jgi:putative holliday junction resolvase